MSTVLLIKDNWAIIAALFIVLVAIGLCVKEFMSKSKEEKYKIAKYQISQIILDLVEIAEKQYEDVHGAGMIKRSKVINAVYARYPVLYMVKDQEELVEWLDSTIKDALVVLEDVMKKNVVSDMDVREG